MRKMICMSDTYLIHSARSLMRKLICMSLCDTLEWRSCHIKMLTTDPASRMTFVEMADRRASVTTEMAGTHRTYSERKKKISISLHTTTSTKLYLLNNFQLQEADIVICRIIRKPFYVYILIDNISFDSSGESENKIKRLNIKWYEPGNFNIIKYTMDFCKKINNNTI